MDSGFSRELDCPAVRNRAMTSGDVCGAGLKAPDFIYSTRLWSNCFFSGLLACSRSRSMLHMINFPFRQFVSNKLARRRLLAKLSTHSTRGVTSVYKLSMQRVFDSVVSRHHCQSVCPRSGSGECRMGRIEQQPHCPGLLGEMHRTPENRDELPFQSFQ